MSKLSWRLSLLAILALPLYVVRFNVFNLPTTLLEILILLAIAVFILSLIIKKNSLTPLSPLLSFIFYLSILWVVVALVSVLYSPQPWAALGLWRAYFLEPVVLIWCIVQQINDLKRLKQLIATAVFSGLAVSLYAIWQHFTGLGIPTPWQPANIRRVTSWLGYPNAVGLLIAPLIPLLLALGKKVKLIKIIVAILMILAVWWAKSEGALVGLLAGAIIAGLIYSKPTRRLTLAALLLGTILIAVIPAWQNKFVSTITLNDCPKLYECSLQLRKLQWAETWQMLSDGKWLYGAGLAGYQTAIAPYHHKQGIEIYLYPHNIFLNFWTELGLLGLLIFLAMIIIFYWQSFKLLKHPPYRALVIAALAAMTTLLVHGLVDVPYFKNDLSVLFWLIFMVPFVVNKIDAINKEA